MKKLSGITIDLSLVNSEDDRIQQEQRERLMGTTYRQEGFSIGRAYLRWEGSTITRGQWLPSSVNVEETIGRGACSVVQRASWRNNGSTEHVALKRFHLESKERRCMLIKELRILCKVECECLVKLLGAFTEQDTVTMVLEYMDKGSLCDFLKTLPKANKKDASLHMPEGLLSAIGYQGLVGLSYLHYENMIHRDVKPANVLIHSNGSVKLSDFGIASEQLVDGLNATVVGTTKYMSPERLRSNKYGSASDMWGYGLILLECAQGFPAWEGISSLVELVLTVEETNTNEMIPSYIIGNLREIICGCLQKEPAKRIPAEILINSPWFSKNGIGSLKEASQLLYIHFGSKRGDQQQLT